LQVGEQVHFLDLSIDCAPSSPVLFIHEEPIFCV